MDKDAKSIDLTENNIGDAEDENVKNEMDIERQIIEGLVDNKQSATKEETERPRN